MTFAPLILASGSGVMATGRVQAVAGQPAQIQTTRKGNVQVVTT